MFSTRSAHKSGCQNTGASIRGGAGGNAWQEMGVEGPFSSSVDLDQLKRATNAHLRLRPRAPGPPSSPDVQRTVDKPDPGSPGTRDRAGPTLLLLSLTGPDFHLRRQDTNESLPPPHTHTPAAPRLTGRATVPGGGRPFAEGFSPLTGLGAATSGRRPCPAEGRSLPG